MAPKAKSLADGMNALFKKREAKAPAAPAAQLPSTSPVKAADTLTTPDTKVQAAAAMITPEAVKRRKLDESGAAAAGGGPTEKKESPTTEPMDLDSGPISLWIGPPGKDASALLSPAFDPASRSSELAIGKPVGFALLSGALADIEAQKGSGAGSRKRSTIVLSNFFRCLLYYRPEDLVPAIYFVSNKVAPDYEESELGIGDATLISAMGECFGRSAAQIKNDLYGGEANDLGEVALSSRAAQKMLGQPPKLRIEQVFAEMKAIATAHGKDCGV